MATQLLVSHHITISEPLLHPYPMNSIPSRCSKHPTKALHSEIRKCFNFSDSCPFCNLPWPEAFDLEATNVTPRRQPNDCSSSSQRGSSSRRGSSSSGLGLTIPHQTPISRFNRSSPSSRSSTPTSSRNERLEALSQHVREATAQTRASKEESPLQSPLGLRLRIKPLCSEGFIDDRLHFFKATKTTLLDNIDIPLISWLDADQLDGYTLLDSHISRFFSLDGFDQTLVRFGTNWVKPPRAEVGTFTAYSWLFEEKRVVLFVEFRIITQELAQVEKPPTSRKRKQAVPIKKEQLLEINLEAFPPTQPLPDVSDDEEEEIQVVEERLREPSVEEPSIEAGDTVESEGEEADEAHSNSEAPSEPSNKRQRIYVNNSNNHHPENRSLSRAGRVRRASAKVRNS